MSESPISEANRILAQAADTDALPTQSRSAGIILERRPLVAALARLRDYTSGQLITLRRIIELVHKMDAICALEHSRLVNGTQDDWKKELPPGKDKEFRALLRQFNLEVKRLAKVREVPHGPNGILEPGRGS